MSHVSENVLAEKTRKQIIDSIEFVMADLSKNELNVFLHSLLSETERIMLAKRLAIALQTRQGIEQKTIANNFNVTRETVDRIHLSTILKPKGFELAARKLKNEKVKKEIKKVGIGVARYAIKAAAGRIDA